MIWPLLINYMIIRMMKYRMFMLKKREKNKMMTMKKMIDEYFYYHFFINPCQI